MRNLWHIDDSKRITPEKFLSCVEISKGSKCKYELDKSTGALILDRILFTSTAYPHNYGFIPSTLSDDGDPLDVLLLCSETIVPLALVECKAIGVLMMNDNGAGDEKIIAVVNTDPFYKDYTDIKELPNHIIDEIKHFFSVYKQLEVNSNVEIETILSSKAAKRIIEESIDRYNKKFKY